MNLHRIASRVAIMFGGGRSVIPSVYAVIHEDGDMTPIGVSEQDLQTNFPAIYNTLECVAQVNGQIGCPYDTVDTILDYHSGNYLSGMNLVIALHIEYIDPDNHLPVFFQTVDPDGILDGKFKQLESKMAHCIRLLIGSPHMTDFGPERVGFEDDPDFAHGFAYDLVLDWDQNLREYVDETGTAWTVPDV